MLAALFTLCLVPRAIMAYRMPGVCPDAVLYIGLGKALEAGQFQEALGQLRLNIYPVILSSLHQLGLSWETAGVAWGVVISSCTVLPLFGWIRRAFSRHVAIAACILFAIHSGLIRWSVEIIRDSTFWFLLTLSLYLLWRAVTELRWAWYLAAGTAIALACLTRFEGLVLLVPLAAWSWRRGCDSNVSRGRLIAAGLVCASIYPLSLLLINTVWFHGRTPDLVGAKPVELAHDWAQESLTGQRAVEKQNRADLLAPLPLGKMAERFAAGMFKGFTPLYLLAVAFGIVPSLRIWSEITSLRSGEAVGWDQRAGTMYSWSTSAGPPKNPCWWAGARCAPLSHPTNQEVISDQIPSRPAGSGLGREYRALAYASALILAAIWVHLYWSHEAGPRYFFSIVIMSAPLAGRGLLQISAAAARYVHRLHSTRTSLLAGAAPLAAMLIVNLSAAWAGDFRSRAGAVDLGRWVQVHYGARPKLYGPDGITQVVNYYAHGWCDSFPETASAATLTRRIGRVRPDVVLLALDRPGPSASEFFHCAAALGFEAVDRSSLPGGCEKLQVLVRRLGGSGLVTGKELARQGNDLAEGTPAVQEARLAAPAIFKGDKPRS